MKYNIGDRIATYYLGDRRTATVEKIYADGDIEYKVDGLLWKSHPKSCRKLVKHVARRFWVQTVKLPDHGASAGVMIASKRPRDLGYTELKEVHRKESK